MQDLTFGEQVKIILGRKGMTIKQLAELIEEKTGKKMSRQNLTQRLGRDNFQEQDMRMIAEMLECPFHLSIMSTEHTQEPRSTAALERAATARVEAVEVSAQTAMNPERVETVEAEQFMQTEAEEPEAKLIEETVPETLGEEAEQFMQTESESELQAEFVQSEAEAETDVEFAQPEVEAETSATFVQSESEVQWNAESAQRTPVVGESTDRDMTIGELYEIHEELNELEKSIKEGESVEVIQKELEKPKKERRLGSFFRRRDPESKFGKSNVDKGDETSATVTSVNEVDADADQASLNQSKENEMNAEQTNGYELNGNQIEEHQANEYQMYQNETNGHETPDQLEQNTVNKTAYSNCEESDNFEPVITYNDAEEDTEAGDVNPYTGREYQSNSVRMHPTRIGYVQVYDRTIHKWTDMTEWAFLGLQERKKSLLGKAYEPPIYLD